MNKLQADYSRREVAELMEEYVHYAIFSTPKQFGIYKGISEQKFKNLIYRAISECIVPNSLVHKLIEKARKSALQHMNSGNCYALGSFKAKYSTLLNQRKTFMFNNGTICDIAISYAHSPLSKKQFCEDAVMTEDLLERILIKAIIENLVADEIFDLLYQKALAVGINIPAVEKLFYSLSKRRAEFKQEHQTS